MINETNVVAGLHEGNSAIQQELFFKLWDKLAHLAKQYNLSTEEIEDISVDTFLKIISKVKELNSIDDIHAYAYVAFRNEIIIYLRRQKRQSEALEAHSYSLNYMQASEEEKKRMEYASEYARNLVAKLPRQQKEVMTLLFFEELPPKQVAERMNITTDNVKATKLAALKSLKILLRNDPGLRSEYFLLFMIGLINLFIINNK